MENKKTPSLSYPSKFVIFQKCQLRSTLVVDSNQRGQNTTVPQGNGDDNQGHELPREMVAEKHVRVHEQAEFWASTGGVPIMAITDPFSTSTTSDIIQNWRHMEDSTITSGRGLLFSVHSSTDFCLLATNFIGSKKKLSPFSIF